MRLRKYNQGDMQKGLWEKKRSRQKEIFRKFLFSSEENMGAQKVNLSGKEIQVKDGDSAKFFAWTFLHAASFGTARH